MRAHANSVHSRSITMPAEIRAAQTERSEHVDCQPRATLPRSKRSLDLRFANGLGKTVELGEQRAIRRRRYTRHKVRARQPPMLDPYVAMIESWLAAEPQDWAPIYKTPIPPISKPSGSTILRPSTAAGPPCVPFFTLQTLR